MNKRLITLGIIILTVCIIGKLLWAGLKNLKVDDFKPAAVIFVVDSSASNQAKLPLQKKFLKQICAQLDPEDQIKIIKVSQEAYMIYEGTPQNSSGITKSMEAFTQYAPEEMGTAYGDGLKKALSYSLIMKKEGYVPAVVVIGDLENEGATEKQICWDTLPENISNVVKYAPDLSMMFLFAHPQKLDMVKEKLGPVLGESKLVLAPEQNVDKALRKFINAIGR
ncbi:MAG: VWA domain-containing protein [Candidatus Gastranaerophilales bacterium]|nr:VWA domain-containing protein [Candidatus Gastranaerophilales bacterium]